MKKKIIIVGGGKGGVGKTMVCASLTDALMARGESVLLIESDTSNPDIYKMYCEELETRLLDLDTADGWIDLVNSCDERKDHTVLINTAARNNKGVAAYSQTLKNTLKELERELVTFWVINRQRDSVELLKEYMEELPDTRVHVVRNGHYGEEAKFELYNDSKLRKQVEDAGGQSLMFPDLADRVSDALYSQRLSIRAALESMPIGNRAELQRWRAAAQKMFERAL
ncbi:P-loop NTPase [Bordetella pseudohinzii]|nr:P-loop NTPase [Bordetella pseudohinzii]